jgi:hypothetical protein
MSVEGQRWNFRFSIVTSLLSSSVRNESRADTPKAEQDVSAIFAPTGLQNSGS